jgi:hypothetical protein
MEKESIINKKQLLNIGLATTLAFLSSCGDLELSQAHKIDHFKVEKIENVIDPQLGKFKIVGEDEGVKQEVYIDNSKISVIAGPNPYYSPDSFKVDKCYNLSVTEYNQNKLLALAKKTTCENNDTK